MTFPAVSDLKLESSQSFFSLPCTFYLLFSTALEEEWKGEYGKEMLGYTAQGWTRGNGTTENNHLQIRRNTQTQSVLSKIHHVQVQTPYHVFIIMCI